MRRLVFALSLLAPAACRTSGGSDAALKDDTRPATPAPAGGERRFAACSRVSYYGGPVAEIRHAAQGNGATLVLEWVKGPDGDGEAKAEVVIPGVWVNADERDPYQHEYKFGQISALLTLERRDDTYPLALKGTHPDGTAVDEGVDCQL